MKVRITMDLDRETRLALAARVGETKPLSRKACADHLWSLLYADLESIILDYDNERAEDEEGDIP